ncbi:MAG: hypothetical protein U0736_25345 [Gemmataceae bacterium]
MLYACLTGRSPIDGRARWTRAAVRAGKVAPAGGSAAGAGGGVPEVSGTAASGPRDGGGGGRRSGPLAAPRSLLGANGEPAGWKQRTGAAVQRLTPADGSFTVRATTPTLLELARNPGHNDYRLTAQVRHLAGDGAVGLYVADTTLSANTEPLHLFTRAGFSERGGDPRADLSTRLLLDAPGAAPVEAAIATLSGPPVPPAGGGEPPWRDVEITVTAETLAARIDGARVETAMGDWVTRFGAGIAAVRPRFPPHPIVQKSVGFLHRRGGIGLYLQNGAASFRNIQVTPLLAE